MKNQKSYGSLADELIRIHPTILLLALGMTNFAYIIPWVSGIIPTQDIHVQLSALLLINGFIFLLAAWALKRRRAKTPHPS